MPIITLEKTETQQPRKIDVLANIVEIEPTQSGNIPEGFLYASIKNIGNVATNVNGVDLEAGEAKDYPFVGKAYSQTPYTIATNAALRILYII